MPSLVSGTSLFLVPRGGFRAVAIRCMVPASATSPKACLNQEKAPLEAELEGCGLRREQRLPRHSVVLVVLAAAQFAVMAQCRLTHAGVEPGEARRPRPLPGALARGGGSQACLAEGILRNLPCPLSRTDAGRIEPSRGVDSGACFSSAAVGRHHAWGAAPTCVMPAGGKERLATRSGCRGGQDGLGRQPEIPDHRIRVALAADQDDLAGRSALDRDGDEVGAQ